MTHYGSGVEYALHCLLHLAGRAGAAAPSARDLAEFQGVSPSFTAKLFTRLERAGLVRSSEGLRGGFRLAREPSEISVLDVVDAVEGPKPLFDCKDIRRNCVLYGEKPPRAAFAGICGIHAVMLEAEVEMRAALARRTLADLARATARKIPARQQRAARDWFAARAAGRRGGTAGAAS